LQDLGRDCDGAHVAARGLAAWYGGAQRVTSRQGRICQSDGSASARHKHLQLAISLPSVWIG